MTGRRAKKQDALTCPSCHQLDTTTSTKMRCPDCDGLCRKCCPTEHGTKFSEWEENDYFWSNEKQCFILYDEQLSD